MVNERICYCFGYTVADIEEDLKVHGRSTIMDRIMAEFPPMGRNGSSLKNSLPEMAGAIKLRADTSTPPPAAERRKCGIIARKSLRARQPIRKDRPPWSSVAR